MVAGKGIKVSVHIDTSEGANRQTGQGSVLLVRFSWDKTDQPRVTTAQEGSLVD